MNIVFSALTFSFAKKYEPLYKYKENMQWNGVCKKHTQQIQQGLVEDDLSKI